METQNNINLKNFLALSLNFFRREQPRTEEEYLDGYALVSHAWISMRNEIDKFFLSYNSTNDLHKLFELAENFFCYTNSSNHNYHSPFMREKWEEMRIIATRVKG